MADVLKHAFVSGQADGGDTTLVRPSNWNAAHAFAGGATGALLVRRSTEADGADWSTNFVGPYAIGGATTAFAQLHIRGTFAERYGLFADTTVSPLVDGSGAVVRIQGALNEAGSGTHADFMGAEILPPTINAGAATLTNASTLKIGGAPSGATNNYALWVAAGTVRVDGAIRFQVGLTATTPATIYLDPGASGWLTVNSGGSGFLWFDSGRLAERMRLTDGGILALGTTVITGAAAGDLILKNAGQLKGVNAAGTTTRQLIEYDASDRVKLAGGGDVVVVGSVISTGAAAGDLVLGNTKALRFVNVAGTSAVGVLTLDSGDNLRIRPTPTGPVSIGDPATTVGSAAGDLILANANRLLFVNFAGTATLRLIGGNTNNNVLLGDASTATGVGSPASFTGAAAGDLVLANNRALRASNQAGTSTLRLIELDGGNAVRIAIGSSAAVGIGSPASFSGAAAGDLLLANAATLRFANVAGTSAANTGLSLDSADNQVYRVPSTGNIHAFAFAGDTTTIRLQQQNSGAGIHFTAESTADHSATAANGAVLYTKDDGGGNTRIVARFNTGDVVVVADQSGNLISKQNLLFDSGTAFVGTLDHAITAARTWTLPNYTGGLDVTDPHSRPHFVEDFYGIAPYLTEVLGSGSITYQDTVGGTVRLVANSVLHGKKKWVSAAKNPVIKLRWTTQGTDVVGSILRRQGVSDSVGTIDPTNGIFFRHTRESNIIAVARSGGVETTLDTGVAMVTGAFHTGTLEVRGGNSVVVFIDGVEKGTIASNVPSALLHPAFMGGDSASGLVESEVDYLYVSQER